MLTAYSRVTVVASGRNIDLALPNSLPLADVLPQVMRYVDTSEQDENSAPVAWTLGRLGGASFSLSQTLSESGVLDGDILELRSQSQDMRPAMIEDVRDALEDSVDAAGGLWTTRTTGSYAVLMGSFALAFLGVAAMIRGSVDPIPAFLVAFTGLGATWWAAEYARAFDAQMAGIVTMGWAAVGAAAIDSTTLHWAWLPVVLASGAALIAAGLARLLTVVTTGHVAFAAVLLVAGMCEVIAALTVIPVAQERRVVPVLAILVVGVLPRVSLSVGGLSSADYRVRHVSHLSTESLRSRYRDSNAILVGCLTGIAVVVMIAAVANDINGSDWDRTLALSLGVAAVMRSRLFSRSQHMLPLRIAGPVVIAAVCLRWAMDYPDVIIWTPLIVAALMAAGTGMASLPISQITRARIKRVLNILEFLVIVDLLVVLCGAMGVYDQVGGIF